MTDVGGWERRVAAVWRGAGDGETVVERIDALVAERPDDDPVAVYERASALDFADRPADAEPLYRRALSLGLEDVDRRRAVESTVQLASTLRLLGRSSEALAVIDGTQIDLLAEERDWLTAFRCLALLDSGRAEEAARGALHALAGHLTQYAAVVRTCTTEAPPSR